MNSLAEEQRSVFERSVDEAMEMSTSVLENLAEARANGGRPAAFNDRILEVREMLRVYDDDDLELMATTCAFLLDQLDLAQTK